MAGYFGSKTDINIKDLWSTPVFVFNYYNSIYDYGVDLAANDVNHLVDCYITEDINAFDIDTIETVINLNGMKGRNVWCNPPYSDIPAWVDLCIEISRRFDVNVTMLIPADTSVKWFKTAWDNASHTSFINGRLSFINATTMKPVNGNNKGSVAFTFGGYGKLIELINRDDMKSLVDDPVDK